jgi:hypothetical protein
MSSIARTLGSCAGVLALALVASGCAEPVPVHSDLLNQTFYTRSVLRNKGAKISSSNYYRSSGGGYPPGSEVQVTMFSEIRVDMTINKIPHQMYPVGEDFNVGAIEQFFEKYFVKSREEIGAKAKNGKGEAEAPPPLPEGEGAEQAAGWRMDLWEKSIAGSVGNGIAAIGMNKEQVLMALGPPPEINFDQYANRLALSTIMEANRWVYYGDVFFFPATFFRKVLTFSPEGKLVQFEQ